MCISLFRSRTLFLSRECLSNVKESIARKQNEEISPSSTEKLDLDGWKSIMKSGLQEVSEVTSETEEDSALVATRELIEMWRLSGRDVPENISEDEMKTFMEHPTMSAKRKYLKFLSIKENIKKSKKEKKEKKQKLCEERKDKLLEKIDNNDESMNTFLLRLRTRSENCAYKWRTVQSMLFGQPLVFDMAFENCMTRRNLENTVKQLMVTEGLNRKAVDPFHLHYCNLKVDSLFHNTFTERYGEAWDELLVTVTEQSYADVFPREELIYLTADSPNVMKTFEHDKIYIVGALVDKPIQTGLSLAHAKRLKLTTALGAKNLTLDQMMLILLSLKETAAWKEALKSVPKRKYDDYIDTDCLEHQSEAFKKSIINEYKKRKTSVIDILIFFKICRPLCISI
uniref:tRNA methyltransferase 10 homolog C n=1 Tax=Sphenodon punctatus TaxID=8508 RepID=A0A8D0HGY7_SPHPU